MIPSKGTDGGFGEPSYLDHSWFTAIMNTLNERTLPEKCWLIKVTEVFFLSFFFRCSNREGNNIVTKNASSYYLETNILRRKIPDSGSLRKLSAQLYQCQRLPTLVSILNVMLGPSRRAEWGSEVQPLSHLTLLCWTIPKYDYMNMFILIMGHASFPLLLLPFSHLEF